MEKNNYDRFDAYLKGQLSSQEEQDIRQALEANPHLKEEWEAYLKVVQTVKSFGKDQLKKKLATWESQNPIETNPASQKLYSLEELLHQFKKIEAYEGHIHAAEKMVARGAQITLLSPENEINIDKKLTFTFKESSSSSLSLIIENSSEDEVLATTIPSQKKTFVLTVEHLIPGRYYWKIHGDSSNLLMGSFFIDQHFMPDEM